MKSFGLCIKLTFLILGAGIYWSNVFAVNNVDSTYSGDLKKLVFINDEFQNRALIILHIAQNAHLGDFLGNSNSVDYIRIIGYGCSFYENQFETEFPLFDPNLNDEFRIIGEDDDWINISLNDGRNAWINEACVQRFTKSETKNSSKLKKINAKNDQLKLAEFIIDELSLLAEEYEKESKTILNKRKTTDNEIKIIYDLSASISKNKALAESAYKIYIEPEMNTLSYVDYLNRLSVISEVQMGGSDFTSVRNEFSQVSQRGLTGDFLLDLKYRIDQESSANIVISNTNEIIQTPFRNSVIEATYKRESKEFDWHTGFSYNKYKDQFNLFNTYDRVGINVGTGKHFSQKSSVRFLYNLNAYLYGNFDGINFNNHSVNLSAKTNLTAAKSIEMLLRGNVQTGEEERRNFYFLYPELRYSVRKSKVSNQYFINYQRYEFSNLSLRDNDRLMMGYNNRKQLAKRANSIFLSISSKTFLNNERNNFFQFDSRFNTNWFDNTQSFMNMGFRINYYPYQTNLNFTDLQFSFGTNGTIFYDFSTFHRFYYFSSPLIDIVDFNIRSGLNIKGFKIGPTLSFHSLINFEQFSIIQDGNFYRFGAFAEGYIHLPYQINVSLSSAYDYGFVYSQQFVQDPSTGDINYGDVNERHPTTFQLNTMFSTSYFQSTDLFFRLNFYVINTDITAAISRNPVEQHYRFTARLGARYTFN